MLLRANPSLTQFSAEGDTENLKQITEVPVSKAQFPAPFPSKLEFNPASHGTWNIVHIGMNVPECQQIYVCAVNCMRGVVLTAAEMKASERFSFVLLREEDLLEGTVEDITTDGVADVIGKLPKRPPAVALFTVCTHHFLGCDIPRIYRELERRFPDIDFIRGYMDPIMQKESPSPDLKLRRDMYNVIPDQPVQTGYVSLLGHNVSLHPDSDLRCILTLCGYTLKQMTDCKNYEEYKSLGDAEMFISCVPNGKPAIERIARRLNRKQIYLPMTFDYDELEKEYAALLQLLNKTDHSKQVTEELTSRRNRCEEMAQETLQFLGDAPVIIDYTVHPRPLGLARYLIVHGFCVGKVYLNGISPEEKEAFLWLKENAPQLILASTILPEIRVLPRTTGRKVLAIGQQAAWFTGTPYFVNVVEGGDQQGYDGILRMLTLMQEAWQEPKDPRDLVPRKGLGCESCI